MTASRFKTKIRTAYGPFAQWLGRAVLKLGGWKLVGRNPGVPRCVIACAPHTSNWDFIWTLAAAMALSLPCVFMIKHTLFRSPLGWLLAWLGGVPVNRSAPGGIVEQMARVMRQHDRINVVITPEGTRKQVEYWKLGFYRIAWAAGVPILFGIMSYRERWIGVSALMYPTGDLEADWAKIQESFQRYVGLTPKYRDNEAETFLREKDVLRQRVLGACEQPSGENPNET